MVCGSVKIESVWPGFWEPAFLEGATGLKWRNVQWHVYNDTKRFQKDVESTWSASPHSNLTSDKAWSGHTPCENIGNQTASDRCNHQPGINSHRIGKRKSEKKVYIGIHHSSSIWSIWYSRLYVRTYLSSTMALSGEDLKATFRKHP